MKLTKRQPAVSTPVDIDEYGGDISVLEQTVIHIDTYRTAHWRDYIAQMVITVRGRGTLCGEHITLIRIHVLRWLVSFMMSLVVRVRSFTSQGV